MKQKLKKKLGSLIVAMKFVRSSGRGHLDSECNILRIVIVRLLLQFIQNIVTSTSSRVLHHPMFNTQNSTAIDVAVTLKYGSVYLNFTGLRHLLLMFDLCV